MTHADLVRLAGSRGRLSEHPTVDPVTAEVVRGTMETVCFEMATYVSRTATTPILNQSNERNATILDAQGRLAALSVGIPQFMLTSTLPVRFALEFLGVDEFREGDVFVANDPYHGGGHLPDYNVFAPIYAAGDDGTRRMVLIASIQCHHGDTGGGVPGGYNVTATDLWGEGVRWPVVKVIDQGVERRDVLYTLQANNRIPDYIGDLRAQIGAAQLAAIRMGEVIDHYGVHAVEESVDFMIDYAAKRFREEVTAWPDGEYEADAYVDHDPLGNPDVHLHVKITVAGDELTIDFTGSDTRQELQAWSTFGNARGYTVGQIAAMMDPEIPKNEGFFDQIKLVVPQGCVLNPAPGKPVSAGTHHPGADVGEVIAVAMQDVLPDKAVPQTYKTGIPTIIVGIDPRTGATFTDHSAEVYAGWCNAAKGMDAWGAQAASFGNLWKATAEFNESLFPHVQWGRDYRIDSGGPGEWRGLCGSHYEKEVRVDAKVYTYVVGMKYPMPGICGGKPGAPNEMIIRYGSDDPYKVKHTADWVPLSAGERVMYDYGGGGGWGNPLERDPQSVLDDVLDEYVSVEGATRDYGVVLTGSLGDLTLAVDEAATTELRAAQRGGALSGANELAGAASDRGSGIPARSERDRQGGYRVGVDVGGTFTDLLCITPAGDVVLDKTPTTLEDQSIGVMTGLGQLAERFGLSLQDFCADLDILVHGTTTADNTMIEMNGAATGLLVTEGHRDEIEMRRVHKEQIWDPSYPAPPPIARRRARIPIPERLDFQGQVILPLDEEAVRKGVRRLQALGVRSIAVMFLFSFVNSEHERRAGEIVREEFPDVDHVSLSHEVMARGPEFERVSTTLVNAYVAPKIAAYVGQLQESLRAAGYGGPLLIMQSTGGVMPPEYVAKRAVSLLASGPTGGVMGAALAAGKVGVLDFVSVDMGGTSFDVCLVRGGRPEIKTDWNWRYRYYIGMPMVDVQSVGAGGGSIARVRQGALLVGPESAGSVPGPVSYGRGGTHPTVTDADVVLGYIPVDSFAGGRMRLDVDAARAAITRDVAEPLGIDVVDAAWGIERIVNANMANATRRVLASHGADPRTLAMIAFGGNGAVHAWAVAAELGIERVLVPKAAPAFSALGVLVADYVVDLVRAYVVPLSQVDVARVRSLLSDLQEEAAKELDPTGLPDADIDVGLYAQMCYPGQNFDMSVPLLEGPAIDEPGLLDLAERFHDQHEAERGFAFRNQQPLLRGLRLIARGRTPKPDHLAELGMLTLADSARTGTRPAYFGDRFVDTAVFDGARLGPGAEVHGPALIEEPFTVVVVPPGGRAHLDESGNYQLELP